MAANDQPEPKISDLFARLIGAVRRGDILQMNDMPEMMEEVRSRVEIRALVHKNMFSKIEIGERSGLTLSPHPLFWMGGEVFLGNGAEAMSREDRAKLIEDAIALMESGINPLPYPVTTFGVIHRAGQLADGTIHSGQVLFIRCSRVKRSDPVDRPDLVLPDDLGAEAICIDLFIGHLKRVYGTHNLDPHGWRYCGGRCHLSIGVKPTLMHTMLCAEDGVTERGKEHAKFEIQDAAITAMASMALLAQQRSVILRDLEPPSYKLRNSISNRLHPLPKMVRVDLSSFRYQYPFAHAVHPTGREMSPHDRRGHVRHLGDGRVTQVRPAKVRGGIPTARTYVIGNQAENQWPDRESITQS